MQASHLLVEELDYELLIRGSKLPITANAHEKRKALGVLLRKERILTDSVVANPESIDSKNEIAVCADKVFYLESAFQDSEKLALPKYKTRCQHLTRRLARIEVLDEDILVVEDLNSNQREKLSDLVESFKQLDRGQLSQTHLVQHQIDTGEARPIKQRYLPYASAHGC